MKIFLSYQINQIIQSAVNAGKVSIAEIIESMANAVSEEIIAGFAPNQRIVMFAGAGTTGAYTIASAVKLVERGYLPEVVIFDISETMIPECKAQVNKLKELIPNNIKIISGHTMVFSPPTLSKKDVVVDGLFGSELSEPLKGESGFPMLIRYINESDAFVISVGLPSGMMSDFNKDCSMRNIIHATTTLIMQYPRLACYLPDAAPALGQWKLVDVGIPRNFSRAVVTPYFTIEEKDIHNLIIPRVPFTDKNDYGKALVIAGSYGMFGAAVLASRATLRAGVGRLVVHSPFFGFTTMQSSVPEAIFDHDKNQDFISDMSVKGSFDAIAVGPGIGTNNTTISALEKLLQTSNSPLVLDADALNCIASRRNLLEHVKPLSIITPHSAEFDRIFGAHTSYETRLLTAIKAAQEYRIFIILKGHHTAVIRPDGKVMFNTTGNPGMAKAGSGDVLTGILTAFLAQHYKPERAAVIAVYIHGLAGDIATRKYGEYGMVASDIVENIGKAIDTVINP